MTPQSSFMIVAPIQPGRAGALRELLATMNSPPGMADPDNPLVPFGRFENLHFARFVVLDDQTTGDIQALYRIERPKPPVYLAFLGDFDGPYDDFIRHLVQHAAPGLRRIFSLCDGFSPEANLYDWLVGHEQRPAAYYCNWVGRTVLQTREEEKLRRALLRHLELSPGLADKPPRAIHEALRRFVEEERGEDRLTLTPPAPTPFSWQVRQVLEWAVLVLLIVTIPLTLIPVLILLLAIHLLEISDPVLAPRPTPQWEAGLADQEDYGVTNQFSAMGSLKPGWRRSFIMARVLWIINLTARLIYTKGRLARVHTIHFARWVYLDNRTRVLFASNYDGSLESYMDDFINKVGFGLNVVFGNGVGYPRTDWLLTKGAKNEQLFKYYLRRHQLPTNVWYNAHAGLTASDLQRNSRIRQGLEASSLSERQARRWVALL
jgi:hypothetical protein